MKQKNVCNAYRKLPTSDKQLRSLMKENRWLKKRLRELMRDLARQKRWYAKVVKVFKDNNNKLGFSFKLVISRAPNCLFALVLYRLF